MKVYPELPAYVKPDLWLDNDNLLQFVRWKDDPDPYLALWWHRVPSGEGWCTGSFAWRNPDLAYFPDNTVTWTLHSWEPLTVSPSLLCLDCQRHGFIREGKWVPV